MRLYDTAQDAFKNLVASPLRTGLTMLGVIIGVAAVISMISIVEGGQQKLVQSIERMGTNLLFIAPKKLNAEERRKFSGRSLGLRYSDVLAVRKIFPELTIAVTQFLNNQQIKVEDRFVSMQVSGTTPEFEQVRNFHPVKGRFLTQLDLDQWRRVVVLGNDVAEQLFGTESPLHREVKIGDQRYTVVGVMEEKGQMYNTNFDEKIMVPITTVFRWFLGNEKVWVIFVHVPDREQMDRMMNQIREILTQRHDGVEDFRIHNQADFLKTMDRAIDTFRAVLGGVALVALLVGGIGIMNIMLVTVTERTGEIGLRKAIGATRRDILLQFLFESTAISTVGGLLGVGLGVGLAYGFGDLVAQSMPGAGDWGAVIQPSAIITAFLFALIVGVSFGLYPAIKASKLDPAEALRYQ